MGGDLVERAGRGRFVGSILEVAGKKDKINGGRDVPPGRLYRERM